jgi:hypothetical protein
MAQVAKWPIWRRVRMTERFRMDNTEGYSQDQLDVLNERFDLAMRQYQDVGEDDFRRKSLEDHVAETVLADYDDETMPAWCPCAMRALCSIA